MSTEPNNQRSKRARKDNEETIENSLPKESVPGPLLPTVLPSSSSSSSSSSSTTSAKIVENNGKISTSINRETEERSRERNRIHARKSRQRRKVFVEHLKSDLENCVYEVNNLQTLYLQAFGTPYVSLSSSSSSSSTAGSNGLDDTTTNDDDDDEDEDTSSDDDSHTNNLDNTTSTTNEHNNGTSSSLPLSKIDREARCRERNRIHAKKSRQRKKLLVEQLKQRLFDKSNDIKAMRAALSKYYGSAHHPDLLKIPQSMMIGPHSSSSSSASTIGLLSHNYTTNDNGTLTNNYYTNDNMDHDTLHDSTTETFLTASSMVPSTSHSHHGNNTGNDSSSMGYHPQHSSTSSSSHHTQQHSQQQPQSSTGSNHNISNNHNDDEDDEYDEQNSPSVRKSLSGRVLRNRPAPLSPSIPQPVKGRGRGRPPKSTSLNEYGNDDNSNNGSSNANGANNTNGMLSNSVHKQDPSSAAYSNMYYGMDSNDPHGQHNMVTGDGSTVVSPYSAIHSYGTQMNSYNPYYTSSSTLPSNEDLSYNHRKRSYQDHSLPESVSHGGSTNSNNNHHHHHHSNDYYSRDQSYYSHTVSSSNASNPSSGTGNPYRNGTNPNYNGMMNSSHHTGHPNDYTNPSKVDYDTAERVHELQGYHHNSSGTNGMNHQHNQHHHHHHSSDDNVSSNNHSSSHDPHNRYPPSASITSSNHSHPSSGTSSSSNGFDPYANGKSSLSHGGSSNTNPPLSANRTGKQPPIEPDYNDPYLIIPALLPPNPLEFILPDDIHIGAAYSKFLQSYQNYYDRELAPKLRYKYGSDGRNIPSCYKPDYYAVVEALILARAGMLPLYNHAKIMNQAQHHTLPPLPPWKAHPMELYVRREYARQLSARPDEGQSVTPTSDSGGASSDARRQGETEQMSMEQKSNSTEESNRSDRSNDDADSSNPESTMVSPVDGDNGVSSNGGHHGMRGHKYSTKKKKSTSSSNGLGMDILSSRSSPTGMDPRNSSIQDQQVAADLVLCMRNNNSNISSSGSNVNSTSIKGITNSKGISNVPSSAPNQSKDSRSTVNSDSSSGQRGDDEDTPSSSSSVNNNTSSGSSGGKSSTNPNFHRYNPSTAVTTSSSSTEPHHLDTSSSGSGDSLHRSSSVKNNTSSSNSSTNHHLSSSEHSHPSSTIISSASHNDTKVTHNATKMVNNNAHTKGGTILVSDGNVSEYPSQVKHHGDHPMGNENHDDNHQLSTEENYNPDSMVLLTFRHT